MRDALVHRPLRLSPFPPQVNALLELGADPNLQDGEGMTALMEAARAPEGFEIAKAIVEAGAAIDLFSKTGVTALSMAASGGNGPVIALLLQHKADVNALHEEGSTALMAAAEMISANNGSMSIIDALLSAGADVNVARCASGRFSDRESGGAHSPQNSARVPPLPPYRYDGLTALMAAAGQGSVKVVEKLIEAGADTTITDSRGVSACHMAAEVGGTDVVAALVRAGCAIGRSHVAPRRLSYALHSRP